MHSALAPSHRHPACPLGLNTHHHFQSLYVKLCCASQAEDAREKAAAAAADAAKLAAQAQVLGREAKLGRELRDDNYRLEESLHAYALLLLYLTSLPMLPHLRREPPSSAA